MVAIGVIYVERAAAVMIRHDVSDAEYQALAAQPDYAASRVALLTELEHTSATLISPRHLITAGHLVAGWVPAGTNEAACTLLTAVGTNVYQSEYVYLFPGYDRVRVCGGFDVAILRLSEAVTNPSPARVWVGGVQNGQPFAGIGEGRTGTGLDHNEPLPGGVFRGYQNTVDYRYDATEYLHWRTDFDNGTTNANTLAYILYDATNTTIAGVSSTDPLPLEGTIAAGDSGSAVYFKTRTGWMLGGIASYRWYSQYGGQAGFVNLSAPELRQWLSDVAAAEGVVFDLVEELPPVLAWGADPSSLLLYGNEGHPYELQGCASLGDPGGWYGMALCTATSIPCTVSFTNTDTQALFLRFREAPSP